MKKFPLIVATLTTAMALSAHAQLITVSTYTSATTWNDLEADPLTAVFTANSSVGGTGGVTANTALVQTFTLGSAISAQSFQIRYRVGGDLGVALFEVADANAATLSLGTQVWSGSATLPNPGGTTTWFADLSLDTTLDLIAGAYAFQISTVDATTFDWRRTSNASLAGDPPAYPGDTYAGGRAYAIDPITGSNSNFVNGSSEFSFAVVAVPEPTTISLVLASLGALYLGMRRRR